MFERVLNLSVVCLNTEKFGTRNVYLWDVLHSEFNNELLYVNIILGDFRLKTKIQESEYKLSHKVELIFNQNLFLLNYSQTPNISQRFYWSGNP